MKIKTLLMCMIAVFISLSGCSKKTNYAINYIGDYVQTDFISIWR